MSEDKPVIEEPVARLIKLIWRVLRYALTELERAFPEVFWNQDKRLKK